MAPHSGASPGPAMEHYGNGQATHPQADAKGQKRKLDEAAPSPSISVNEPEPTEATQPKRASNALDPTLPPVGTVYEAFHDMMKRVLTSAATVSNDPQLQASRFPDLRKVAEKGGFVLNVVTMCSGTEAPIFAMKLIQEVFFAECGLELFKFKHLFSVEIEPFKQTYIRRNTDALLFRDVCDFYPKNLTEAPTALGSMEKIPKNPDILFAGTSCVSFSSLNTQKQTKFHPATKKLHTLVMNTQSDNLDADQVRHCLETIMSHRADMGESDRTFFSVLSYIHNQRPPIVILENVKGAPFEDAKQYFFPAVGYDADFLACDTKDYYLPQTRGRKYLVAFDKYKFGLRAFGRTNAAATAFVKYMELLKRRASVDVEKFFLNHMDKSIQRDIQQMEHEKSDKPPREVSWAYSQVRHNLVREEENLGDSFPLSGMKKTGELQFYDRADQLIMKKIPPRVAEAADINLLRGWVAGYSYDNRFKAQLIDFSQNVDRSKGYTFGLSPCLTPAGFAFLTNQVRFLTGREYLILQGLPPSMINIANETYDELKDLAGNAMTTTVVGAAFLSAILGLVSQGYISDETFPRVEQCGPDHIGSLTIRYISEIIKGDLEPFDILDLWAPRQSSVENIIALAAKYRSYCYCNGITMYSSRHLYRCRICGTIRCGNCKGNPRHDYEKLDLVPSPIGHEEATNLFMNRLPPVIEGLFDNKLSEALTREFDHLPESTSESFRSKLKNAIFCFEKIHLAETISIFYSSGTWFDLKIMVDEHSVTWYLFMNTRSILIPAADSANLDFGTSDKGKHIRQFCLRGKPFARARLTPRSAFNATRSENSTGTSSIPKGGDWAFWAFDQAYRVGNDRSNSLLVNVQRHEDGPDGKQSITVSPRGDYHSGAKVRAVVNLLYGTYIRQPQCDTAENSLYVHQENEDLYLFKDPARYVDAKLDTFVLSKNPRLIQAHEHREVLLEFVPLEDNSKQLHFLDVGTHLLKEKPCPPATLHTGLKQLQVARGPFQSSTVCVNNNHVMAEMTIDRQHLPQPLALQQARWNFDKTRDWVLIPSANHAELFKSIAFVLPTLSWALPDLTIDNLHVGASLCVTCTTSLPQTHWILTSDCKKWIPINKPAEVHAFETGLRHQASAFQVYLAFGMDNQDSNYLSIRIVMNSNYLAHRALSLLPNIEHTLQYAPPTVSLKAMIEANHSDSLLANFRPFSNSITVLDEGSRSTQQPSFVNGNILHAEQLVTVAWMLEREKHPETFVEREDVEEVPRDSAFRVVGRAERTVKCAGGIVADDVGFGKTVITLGLIALQRQHDLDGFTQRKAEQVKSGLQALNATLIIVPSHIVKQWEDEVKRFITEKFVSISQHGDLKEFRNLHEARIVIVSDSLLAERTYRAQLSKWGSRPEHEKPSSASRDRSYEFWHSQCVANIRKHLGRFLNSTDRGAHEKLAFDISGQYSSVVDEIRSMTDECVQKSSRKITPGNQDADAQSKLDSKTPPPISHEKLFMHEDPFLLEFFSWSRIVWDEVSYNNVEVAQFVSTASAPHKWLLSGTPPKQTLADITNLARVLGLHIARPIDLRLGLPRICRGPELSPRTEVEEYHSHGKLFSDKIATMRHEQAEMFLQSFSCANESPVLKVKVHNHVVVSSPTLAEVAFYEDMQQSWRRAQMTLDQVEPKAFSQMLEHTGYKSGPIPKNLAATSLVYAASLPKEGTTLNDSREDCVQNLQETKRYMKLLFDRILWLANRLGKCNYADSDKDGLYTVTATFRRLLDGLQDGNFGIYSGVDTYCILLKAVFPNLTVKRSELLRQAVSSEGLDLLSLQIGGITPRQIDPIDSTKSHMQLLNDLYSIRGITWTNFYTIKVEKVSEYDRHNLLELLREHIPSVDAMSLSDDNLTGLVVSYCHGQSPPRAQSKTTIGEKIANLTKEGAQVECRIRGLKYTSATSGKDMRALCLKDEAGGAGLENYAFPTPKAAAPGENIPLLNKKKRIRGANVSVTRNAFRVAVNMFIKGLRLLHANGNQLRRAAVFCSINESKAARANDSADMQVPRCFDCSSTTNLFLIFECGHILCQQCKTGKELCGDGTTACPSVLEYNATALATVKKEGRVLKLSDVLNSPPHDREPATGTPEVKSTPKQVQMKPPPKKPHLKPSSKKCQMWSSKIQSIVDIVKQIDPDQKVVVFAQYDLLLETILKALIAENIKAETTAILNSKTSAGTDKEADGANSKIIQAFKEKGGAQVLVQKLNSAESAGSNLTVANHVIFAAPLITDNQDDYDAFMKQARGRCYRRGQTRDVHIYHCVVEGTYEVNLLGLRNKSRITAEHGRALGQLISARPLAEDGSEAHVTPSALTDTEVWKATGEIDFMTTLGLAEEVFRVHGAQSHDEARNEAWSTTVTNNTDDDTAAADTAMETSAAASTDATTAVASTSIGTQGAEAEPSDRMDLD
ncbi:hypothetical protein JX266_008714 [Neoarthrinium moseri]|nr:hypothetical protein JX266_008714 [Neoarthrinium moseri]